MPTATSMNQSALASDREPSVGQADTRPAKRNRITVACKSCRQRKSRCDGLRPKCSTCTEHEFDCVYSNSGTLTKSSASKELVGELQNRVATLEGAFARLASRVSQIEGVPDDGACSTATTSQAQSHLSRDPDLSEGNADAPSEVRDPTDGIGSMVFTEEEDSGFFGPSSNIAFTRQLVRATRGILKKAASTGSPVSPNDATLESHVLHMSRPPSPASNLSSCADNHSCGTEPFILPPREETVRLIELYFTGTGILFPYIDQSDFLETYRQLTMTNFSSVRRSWLGLLNVMLAMTTRTNTSDDTLVTAQERAIKSDIFYRRAMILCDRQIRHGTSLEVVQMLLLASQYLQGTERSIETWNLHGLAVKVAYQLGLHSPDALQQYPPLEREIRKRTWFGCVMLDRTLSMTMGRPVSIPERFVKVELPQLIRDSQLSTMNNDDQSEDSASVSFFTATITLYRIMSDVLDVLYGSNLGCGTPSDVFEIASHVLQYEQKFLLWQHMLSKYVSLITQEDMVRTPENFELMRLRVILTLRFLNLRILTHRPLLCKYLEIIGSSHADTQQLTALRQVGASSVRICVQSALSIIQMTRWALVYNDPSQQLLGAWWFSLYYAFNAALVIYSALLLHHRNRHHNLELPIEELELSMRSLQEAIECLSMIFKGNAMVEKCVRYTCVLAHWLSQIYQFDHPPETDVLDLSQDKFARYLIQGNPVDPRPHENLDFFNSTDLHLGIGFEGFFQHADAEFMSGYLVPTLADNTTLE